MKRLTIVVPCYNAQSYMRTCIDSLLLGGEAVDILIVDDGSTDETGVVADAYAARFPAIVRVIHQENKGHGGAVNAGVGQAAGTYVKVVDSDDWLDPDAYRQVLSALDAWGADGPDMVVTNFVYEKQGKKRKQTMRYARSIPAGRVLTWEAVRRFPKGRYLLMHSLLYKTEVLRKCALKLPEHTFYVDNLYAYLPLLHVTTLYYLDVDWYHYYIGREGQSVQEDIMIRRIDQQLRVNRMMLEAQDLQQIEPPPKRAYMLHYLEIVTTVSSVLLLRGGTAEHLQKKQALWRSIMGQDKALYQKLRYGMLGTLLNLPGRAGRRVTVWGYQAAQRRVGFN